MKASFLLGLLGFLCGVVNAQNSSMPFNRQAYHIIDRLDISSGLATPFPTALKYYQRGEITEYALEIDTDSSLTTLSRRDQEDLQYLFWDNNEFLAPSLFPTPVGAPKDRRYRFIPEPTELVKAEDTLAIQLRSARYQSRKPLLKVFYPSRANMIEVNRPALNLRVNPLLNLWTGQPSEKEGWLLQNQRGLEIRGDIDERIYFVSNILESQVRFPDYINRQVTRDQAIPGAGFYKPYRSQVFTFEDGYDFLLAQGYVGMNVTRHVGVQFGHGRHFIGNGYRSLLLSDFSNDYLYLKLNWQVWRFHLQNIFAELALESGRQTPGDVLGGKKYMAAHYLSFQPWPNVEVGFYEAVIFQRNNQFELQYLNPVILYRSVEQLLGSPDNVVIGLDAKWNLWRRFQIYGQLVFDEFKFDELFLNNNQWWGNKYGIQAGVKYIDAFGIDHLDLQVETNWVRPYTYSHFDSSAVYSNYNQPLAHPAGANFKEYIGRLRYQPHRNWTIQLRAIRLESGEDFNGSNWGGNVLLPNSTRELNEGSVIGQGIGTDILILGGEINYQFWHNMYLELEAFYRDKVSEDPSLSARSYYLGGGIRMNLSKRYYDF
jgi:hypothetical protein